MSARPGGSWMRRLIILALLLGGMRLILPLGAEGQGAQRLLSFGFLILAAYTVGEIATAVRLPRIVGYLVSGVVFGPAALGVVSQAGVAQLAPVSQLAIALIAFLAGAELRWREVRDRGVVLLKLTASELLTAFAVLSGLIYLGRDLFPFLRGLPEAEVVAFALLFGSIAIVHSPAVTMALLTETGARGPVARTTLGVVLIADIVVVVLFTASLAVARAIAPPGGGAAGASILSVAWEISGAVLVGAVLGAGIAFYLRHVGRDLIFFAVLIAFFGIEIARLLHVELLLTLLVAGFVTENTSREGEGTALLHAMERSAAPLFVVFFALSGAKIDPRAVVALLPLVVPLALARGAAIGAGMWVGSRWAGVAGAERRFAWMGLISQAGVAIGLAGIVVEAYPGRADSLAALLLALIAVNETLGPILFRRALQASGELEGVPPREAPGTAPGGEGFPGVSSSLSPAAQGTGSRGAPTGGP